MSATSRSSDRVVAAAPGPDADRQRAPHSRRRPALDGIRALAVIAVAIYHFGDGDQSWLPGGFLGVDVFFVLSGYLITGLLLSEYGRTGRIGLRDFWVRRARRLVPALVLMLLVVIGYIWWSTPPEGYPHRRLDVFWTVGYLANWHFMQSADDYFAAYATASPLRHTWSLAVEEQFYLVWPLLVAALLWLGHRLGHRPQNRRGLLLPVGIAAAIGMALSVWSMASSYSLAAPSTAYYSTQGRVQELFAGVLLAVLFGWARASTGLVDRIRSARWVTPLLTGMAVAALLALVWALFTMSDTAPFYYRGGALLVSLAVVLLIAGVELRPRTPVARGLSIRPMAALGVISYGVYLWHWPLTVAFPVEGVPSQTEVVWRQTERIGWTLVLATASFWLVERPIQRDRRLLRSRIRVLGAVVVSMALVLVAGVSATALPAGWSYQLTVTSARSCPGESADHLVACLAPAGASTAQPPAFMLLGDSTARALGKAFDTWAEQNGRTWYEAAWNRCSATGVQLIPNGRTAPDLTTTSCSQQAPAHIRAALETYRPRTVLIHELQPSTLTIVDPASGRLLLPGTPEHAAYLLTAYERLIDEIASYGGRAVFVAMPPPGQSIAPLVAGGRAAGKNWNPRGGQAAFVDGFNEVLRQAARSRPDDATLISLTDVLCPKGPCPAVIGGTIVRNDGTHYSIDFAQRLAPIVLERAGIS